MEEKNTTVNTASTPNMEVISPSTEDAKTTTIGSLQRKLKRCIYLYQTMLRSGSEFFPSIALYSLNVGSALRRYTKASHIAGNGQDKLDALNLKNEWERLLGVPVSGPEEKVYEAGSVESQQSVRGGMNKLDVWVDTVSPGPTAFGEVDGIVCADGVVVLPPYDVPRHLVRHTPLRPSIQSQASGRYRRWRPRFDPAR